MNSYLEKPFSKGYLNVASASTYTEGITRIEPVAGKRVAVVGVEASAGSSAKTVVVIMAQAGPETTFAAAAASGASVMYLSGTAKTAEDTPGDTGLKDTLCIDKGDGTYLWEEASALGNSSHKLTIKGGLGAAIAAGAKIWNLGTAKLTGNPRFEIFTSTSKKFENAGGLWYGKGLGRPAIIQVDNNQTKKKATLKYIYGGYIEV